jgi:hypothetical protein
MGGGRICPRAPIYVRISDFGLMPLRYHVVVLSPRTAAYFGISVNFYGRRKISADAASASNAVYRNSIAVTSYCMLLPKNMLNFGAAGIIFVISLVASKL